MRGTEGRGEEEGEREGDFGWIETEGKPGWQVLLVSEAGVIWRTSAVWGPQQPFQETCSRLWPQKESFLRNPANCTNTNQHGNVNNNTQT